MSDEDTLRRLYQQQLAADRAEEAAKRVEAENRFRRGIEAALTEELRNALHLTFSGTTATFHLKGRLFTITEGGDSEMMREYGRALVAEWHVCTPSAPSLWVYSKWGNLQSRLLGYLARLGCI